MTKALVDSGSSVSLISWSFLNTLGFSGKMENYNGKVLTANKTQVTVKGKAELIVQLEKFSPELQVGLLISSVDILIAYWDWIFSQNSIVFCILNVNIFSAVRLIRHWN